MYSKSRENSQKYDVVKKDKSLNQSSMSLSSATAPFVLSSLCLPILFTFYVIYTPTFLHFSSITNNELHHRKSHNGIKEEEEQCDLFKGRWIWDQQGSLYTNVSCTSIPHLRNCLLHGRMDRDFLNWRWKPDQCDLPRFDAKAFLSYVQGKTMAFIGDSLGRNQMESLLCLLSSEESPTQVFKDDEDRFTTWHFPVHNFTLVAFWSQFLVKATERTVNGSSTTTGSFDLHLDRIDDRWSTALPTIDYAIFSDAHWFFRQHSLYEDGKLIGCVYCQSPNVTDVGPSYAIRKAFRAAFDEINNCRNCSGMFTLLRTFSPAHFENGSWDKGGGCNRTRPFTEEEVADRASGADAEYRKVQMEEIERARKEGEKWGNKFEVVDVTRAMLLRPDGHPGLYWGNKWMKGYNDCIHWCLPGPVDTWNELLLYMLRKQLHRQNSPTN